MLALNGVQRNVPKSASGSAPLQKSRKRKTHKHKQVAGLSRDWAGGKILSAPLQKSRKRKTHKHKQVAGLSRDWAGGKIFFGSFLMGEKEHINRIPLKIPGQSCEIFVYVFCSLCVSFRTSVWK